MNTSNVKTPKPAAKPETETEKYIKAHISRVQRRLKQYADILIERGKNHDKSKLEEPELSGYINMDKEPRYPYGSKEYFDKMERYKSTFEHHYKNNRHHPEFYSGWIEEMDLFDIAEMLADWISYSENVTYTECISIIENQSDRFGLSQAMKSILLNTLRRYFTISEDEKAWAENSFSKLQPDLDLLKQNFG